MTLIKALKTMWQDGSIMRDVIAEIARMVQRADDILHLAWAACRGESSPDELNAKAREHDKAINNGERTARRLIAEHLTINPGDDVSGCLAVVIMAKDIERLGDHARSVLNVARHAQGDISRFRHFKELDHIVATLCELLPVLRSAIEDSSEAKAHEVMRRYQETKKKLKELQRNLLASDLDCEEAVATTLLARDLLRINAHAGNAASAVIFPIENIDFVSRGLREEEGES